MRESVAAAGIICRSDVDRPRWLARWNRHWQCYHLVGGHKNPNESFRQCVIREIGEELGWQEGEDFLVSSDPLQHLQYTAWSEGAHEETAYMVELFAVELPGDAVARTQMNGQDVRWLTKKEIVAQRCADGRLVSATMARLLDGIGWRCPGGSKSRSQTTGGP